MTKRILAIILLAIPLLSVAPVPAAAPAVYWTRIAIQTSAPAVQACTFETAPPTARLSAPIFDPIGYPYGSVQAWSCSGDTLAVANELAERASAMQAAAAAYRQAHPLAP